MSHLFLLHTSTHPKQLSKSILLNALLLLVPDLSSSMNPYCLLKLVITSSAWKARPSKTWPWRSSSPQSPPTPNVYTLIQKFWTNCYLSNTFIFSQNYIFDNVLLTSQVGTACWLHLASAFSLLFYWSHVPLCIAGWSFTWHLSLKDAVIYPMCAGPLFGILRAHCSS